MWRMTATEIARATRGRIFAGSAEAVADSCVIDSREARAGSLFAAFIGEHVNGHDFLGTVAGTGATIALVSEPVEHPPTGLTLIQVDDMLRALQDLARYQRSKLDIPVIGITGSTGKTSTKEMMRAALGSKFRVVATESNNNNELGVPLTVLSADVSTELLIVEMGMRARGEITLLAGIVRPQIGVITTIGTAHLALLGSRENIARAKAELFEALPPEGLAVYQAGTPFGSLLSSATVAQRCTVGVDPEQADIVATDIYLDDRACAHAQVTLPGKANCTLDLSIPGIHNIGNALLVLAVGTYLGLDAGALCSALSRIVPVGMRLEVIEMPGLGVNVLADAYNANPDSMAAALRSLAALQPARPEGRRIAVLGDMLELGEESADAHREVLAQAKELGLGCLFVFGSEFGAVAPHEVAYDDMGKLIRSLCSFVRPGDVILVKGSRGMRMERAIEALQAKELKGDPSSC